MGYQCVLLIVCMFSGWIEAFPCHKGCLHSGKEIVGEQVFHLGCTLHNLQWLRHPLHWENHTNLHESLENLWESSQCPYHPQSPDKVDRKNEILELKISKLTETTRLPWLRCCLCLTDYSFTVATLGNRSSTLDSHQCPFVYYFLLIHHYPMLVWPAIVKSLMFYVKG